MQKETERARPGLQQLTMMMLAVSGVVFATTAKVLADPMMQTTVLTNQSNTLFGKTSLGDTSASNQSGETVNQNQLAIERQAMASAAEVVNQAQATNSSAQQVVSQAVSEVTQTTSLADSAVSAYPEQPALQQTAMQASSQQQQVGSETVKISQVANALTSRATAFDRLAQFSGDDQLLVSAVKQATSMAGDLSLLADQMRSFAIIANGWRVMAGNNVQTIQQLLLNLPAQQSGSLTGQPVMLWQPNFEHFMPTVREPGVKTSILKASSPQSSSNQMYVNAVTMQSQAMPKETGEHSQGIRLSEQTAVQRPGERKAHVNKQQGISSKTHHRHTRVINRIVKSKKVSRLNELRQTLQFMGVLAMILAVTLIYRMIIRKVIVIKDGQYLISRNGQVRFASVSVNSATVLSSYFAAKHLLSGEHGYVIVSAHKFKTAIRKKIRK